MKKVYATLWIMAVLLLMQQGLQAQATLGLHTTSISNSSPAIDEEISLFTKLINTSATDTFNGVIDFSLANENGVITDVSVFGKPAVSGNILTLAPLQEMTLLFTVTPRSAYYVPGPDIIIVWPIASAPIVDSAKADIDIQQATGIENNEEQDMKIFVSNNILHVQNSSTTNTFQQVQIFNSTGALIISQTLYSNYEQIPLSNLAGGMYIAAVLSCDGKRYLIKFAQ